MLWFLLIDFTTVCDFIPPCTSIYRLLKQDDGRQKASVMPCLLLRFAAVCSSKPCEVVRLHCSALLSALLVALTWNVKPHLTLPNLTPLRSQLMTCIPGMSPSKRKRYKCTRVNQFQKVINVPSTTCSRSGEMFRWLEVCGYWKYRKCTTFKHNLPLWWPTLPNILLFGTAIWYSDFPLQYLEKVKVQSFPQRIRVSRTPCVTKIEGFLLEGLA